MSIIITTSMRVFLPSGVAHVQSMGFRVVFQTLGKMKLADCNKLKYASD